MLNIFITLLFFVLFIVCLFMVLVILMQRPSNAGMGSAFGGGAAESAFGAETTNVLMRATKWSAVTFLLLCFVLYLLNIYRAHSMEAEAVENLLPAITETAEPAAPAAQTDGSVEVVIPEAPAPAEEPAPTGN